jgi:phage terminase large subunit
VLSSTLQIKTAAVFLPLIKPSRYKGAYGGRGSGKSHFFAELMVETCLIEPGTSCLCIREVLKDLKDSSKQLLENKIQSMGVGTEFGVFRDRIVTPGNGTIIFQGMNNHNSESVKSLEGFKYAWLEEAQTISERSLALLRPTIRLRDSEIWASWNPTRKKDAIDQFLRANKPSDAITIKANWRDNPWFSETTLEKERLLDLERYPDRYDHIWEGDYAKALEGAYFSRQLSQARADGRIGHVAQDPLLPLRAVFDLGGSGASADAMAIWIVQWVGREIRVLDYIEGQGQVLAYYVNELRSKGYGSALCILPHDGVNENNITGKRYEDHVREAGFQVKVIKNQGKGAAMMRVEAARRLFPKIWFNEATTEHGRDALGFYHEKKSEQRDVGLGPEHDWSSHAADAFGLMCVAYQEPDAPGSDDGSPMGNYGGGWG